jgi:hypothetical protein
MGMPNSTTDDPGNSNLGKARIIAAQAKSLRGTLLRDRPADLHVGAGELADAVELIELLANEVSGIAEKKEQEADFQLLLQIVLSDQLTHDQVAQLLRDHPDLARWYEAQKRERSPRADPQAGPTDPQ